MRRYLNFIMCFVICVGTLTLPVNASTFADVPNNHWAYNDIVSLTERGIIAGMGDGKFAPDSYVTREQFIKLLVLSSGIKVFNMEYFESKDVRNPQICAFDDLIKISTEKIDEWPWSAPYVYTAVMNSIVKYSDYTPTHFTNDYMDVDQIYFKPTDPLTREETARYIARALELTNGAQLKFSDTSSIVYGEDVAKTVKAGIMKGFEDNSFKPQGYITRAEMAVIMSRILNYIQINPIRAKVFEKEICDVTKVDSSEIYADVIAPYTISKAEWNSYKDGDKFVFKDDVGFFSNETYTVGTEDIFKGLYNSQGTFAVVPMEYNENNYALYVNAGGPSMIYKRTGKKVMFNLSDNFYYFLEYNDAGSHSFNIYNKEKFIEMWKAGNKDDINYFPCVTLQVVDGKVLFAYNIG